METIPSPVYIGILVIMWTFAGIRGGPFPMKLVSLYSAFFIVCSYSQYLVSKGVIDYSAHAVLQCLSICAIYDFAKQARSIKAVNRFCYATFGLMFVSIYAYILDANYETLTYSIQNTLLNIHNLLTVILDLYVCWLFMEIIDGTRGSPIYKRFLASIFYSLSVFAPNHEAFIYESQTGNKER